MCDGEHRVAVVAGGSKGARRVSWRLGGRHPWGFNFLRNGGWVGPLGRSLLAAGGEDVLVGSRQGPEGLGRAAVSRAGGHVLHTGEEDVSPTGEEDVSIVEEDSFRRFM